MVELTKRSKFRIIFSILLCLLIISIITIAAIFIKAANIPNEVKQVANSYLTASKDGIYNALSYCYFKEENKEKWTRTYKESNIRIYGYKIKTVEKINDNLYELFISYNSSNGKEEGNSYVAIINDKYYFIINQRDIPDDIKGDYKPKISGLEGEVTLLS